MMMKNKILRTMHTQLLQSNIKFFSTKKDNKYINDSFHRSILSSLKPYINNPNISYTDKEKEFELYLHNQYMDWDKNNKVSSNRLGINWDNFPSKLRVKLLDFKDNLDTYIKLYLNNSNSQINPEIHTIIKDINDINKIYSILTYNYLVMATSYDNTSYLLDFAIKIGKGMYRQYELSHYTLFLKDNPNIKISIVEWRTSKYYNIIKTDDSLLISLGSMFVEYLKNFKLLNIKQYKIKREQSKIVITIPNNINNFLDKSKIYTLPFKLPMLCKPLEYTPNKIGGYLLNPTHFGNELIISKNAYKHPSEINKTNIIYEVINSLSSCPYKINKQVLSFILDKGIKYKLIEDPNTKHKFEDIEEKTHYQSKVVKSFNSKIYLQNIILEIAKLYNDVPQFYFPVRMDHRGRIYCESSYFNYQSDDLAKSLLLFSSPGKIKRDNKDAIEYFKLYGANCFGLDKKSFNFRVNWVDQNKEAIINYENGELLAKSKNKLLFLAFCIEYSRWDNYYHSDNNEPFNTYLPIQLDATCNGFQHLSLLSQQSELFDKLNISKTNKDNNPADFYSFVLYSLSEKIKNLLLTNKEDQELNRLNNFYFNRTHLKKAIMTIPYNVSLGSMRKYIRESLYQLSDEDLKKYNLKVDNKEVFYWFSNNPNIKEPFINNKDLITMTNLLNEIIFDDLPKIKKLSTYLKNISTVCTELNVPIAWNLPNGLDIKQGYLQTKSARITPFKSSRSSITFLKTLDKYDRNKQKLALMPNLIHSLDATSLIFLKKTWNEVNCESNESFYTIHDCFAVTADKVLDLIKLLKAVYINIYIDIQYLQEFDKGIISTIKNNYGEAIKYDEKTRTFTLDEKKYRLLDIDWVFHNKLLSNKSLKEIQDSLYLLN